MEREIFTALSSNTSYGNGLSDHAAFIVNIINESDVMEGFNNPTRELDVVKGIENFRFLRDLSKFKLDNNLDFYLTAKSYKNLVDLLKIETDPCEVDGVVEQVVGDYIKASNSHRNENALSDIFSKVISKTTLTKGENYKIETIEDLITVNKYLRDEDSKQVVDILKSNIQNKYNKLNVSGFDNVIQKLMDINFMMPIEQVAKDIIDMYYKASKEEKFIKDNVKNFVVSYCQGKNLNTRTNHDSMLISSLIRKYDDIYCKENNIDFKDSLSKKVFDSPEFKPIANLTKADFWNSLPFKNNTFLARLQSLSNNLDLTDDVSNKVDEKVRSNKAKKLELN